MAALYKISCGQKSENTVLTQCRQSETTLFSFQSLQGGKINEKLNYFLDTAWITEN